MYFAVIKYMCGKEILAFCPELLGFVCFRTQWTKVPFLFIITESNACKF